MLHYSSRHPWMLKAWALCLLEKWIIPEITSSGLNIEAGDVLIQWDCSFPFNLYARDHISDPVLGSFIVDKCKVECREAGTPSR